MASQHDSSHPFDAAYGVMKSLQNEVAELRKMLKGEQQQRSQEVGLLQQEVSALRQRLATEREERLTFNERVTCALTSETAMRGKAMEKCRAELAEADRKREENAAITTTHERQLAKLVMGLETEIRERQMVHKDLDQRLSAEIGQRENQCRDLAKDFQTEREKTEANISYSRDRIHSIEKSMSTAGQLLGFSSPAGEFDGCNVPFDLASTASPMSPDLRPGSALSAQSPY